MSMDSLFLDELQNIVVDSVDDEIVKTKLTLPYVFIDDRYVGGVEEVN